MNGFKDEQHAREIIDGFLKELTQEDDKMLA